MGKGSGSQGGDATTGSGALELWSLVYLIVSSVILVSLDFLHFVSLRISLSSLQIWCILLRMVFISTKFDVVRVTNSSSYVVGHNV